MSFTNLTQCFQKLLLANNSFNKVVNVRNYCRWTHRRPRRVIYPNDRDFEKESSAAVNLKPESVQDFSEHTGQNESILRESIKHRLKKEFRSKHVILKDDNLFDFDKLNADTFSEINSKTNRTEIEKKKKKKKYSKPLNADQEKQRILKDDLHDTKIDENGNLVFNKVHDNAKIIGSLMLNVKSRNRREKDGHILLEGKRLIRDGILAGCQLETLIFSRDRELDALKGVLPTSGIKIYKMTYRDMQMWSDLTTCPGIMGLFKTPNTENHLPAESSLPLTILCDNVRDPGNLGSILRAAAAVGCRRMFLLKGCVDLWDTKVLRSAAGAHFRLPIYKDIDWDEVNYKIGSDSTIFVAETSINRNFQNKELENLNAGSNTVVGVNKIPVLPYHELDYSVCSSLVLIIGGETEGISEQAYTLALENSGVGVHIPLLNGVESLNTGTALGVIAFEMRRQFASLKNRKYDSDANVSNI